MGKQMTEMLKGTLEGIVLAIVADGPAYGYDITARLRDQGFVDIVEGTIYAVLVRIEQRGLVDVEKVPSGKGPPRKVFTLNADGARVLAEFWSTWSFLADRIERLRTDHHHEGESMANRWIEVLTGSLDQKKQYKQHKARIDGLPEPYATAAKAMHRYLLYYGGATEGETLIAMFGDLADLWERAAADGTRVRAIAGDDPVEFAESFAQAYSGTRWIDKERARLTEALDEAELKEKS